MMKCRKLFEIIDSLQAEYIQFLTDICTIESPTENKAGVDRVGQYFEGKAIAKGWLVERQEQPISGDVLCITMNPDAQGAPVCFSGHMDTVHPVGSFGEVPVHCDEEKIYGPGVIDCKGGLAASFMAMDALERCGLTDRPVKLLLQSDEENGSRNSNKTTVDYMYEKSKDCVAFLNTEIGTMGSHIVTTKGICKYRFEITGRSVHSSRCGDGASAICEAAQKIIRLEQFKDKETITCNCGLIQGGTAENTVPEHCTFTADFRFYTEAERQEIVRFAEEIASTSFVEGTSCKLTLASYRCAMPKNEKNMQLFEKVKKIYLDNGLEEIVTRGFFGATDAADLTQKGLPCLEGFGLLGGNLHSLEEYAYINSLSFAAKRMAAIAYCLE